MNDDWRLRVDLDDEAHGYPLTERLRALSSTTRSASGSAAT